MNSQALTSETNQHLFRRDHAHYSSLELDRVEQSLLARFRDRWPEVRMLDLGIGSGRTTYTFGPLAGRYEGIDYAPEAIEHAEKFASDGGNMRLQVGDARALDQLFEGPFDLILFSFNGIDAVAHDERLEVLRQVRGLLAEDGLFAFSSHSVHALPLDKPAWTVDPRNPLRSAYGCARVAQERRRVQRLNAGVDTGDLRAKGWGLVADGAHGFELRWYYVTAPEQVRQLHEAGFADVEVRRHDGTVVDPADPGRDPWLHYLCRPG